MLCLTIAFYEYSNSNNDERDHGDKTEFDSHMNEDVVNMISVFTMTSL